MQFHSAGRSRVGAVQFVAEPKIVDEGCRAHFEFEERLVETIAGLRRQHSDPVRLRQQVLAVLRAAGMGRSDAS